MARKKTKKIHQSDRVNHLLFQTVGIFIDAENIELSGLKHQPESFTTNQNTKKFPKTLKISGPL